MTREEKNKIIDNIYNKIKEYNNFYLTDIEKLNAEQISFIRRKCFENKIKVLHVKNTLLKKALKRFDNKFDPLFDTIKGSTTIFFCNTPNTPALLIKELRQKGDKPILKAAYVEECFYIGDEQLTVLSALKSKNELIAEVVTLLQSPIRNIVSSLQFSTMKIHGILKKLENK
ncbi:MAG: 50S ribosomal protein L10 [Bacteroidales bacterium]|nr:50S ribosomal protein L10 [Bacteroidales bacterium]